MQGTRVIGDGGLDPVPAPPSPSSVAAPRRPMDHEGTQGVGGSCREGHHVVYIGCKLDEHELLSYRRHWAFDTR